MRGGGGWHWRPRPRAQSRARITNPWRWSILPSRRARNGALGGYRWESKETGASTADPVDHRRRGLADGWSMGGVRGALSRPTRTAVRAGSGVPGRLPGALAAVRMVRPMPAAKTHYGERYWFSQVPSSRRATYPRHRGTLETDVAVVGGGALGCVAACVFAAAGVKVALFESSRIAHGDAAGGSGIVLHEPEADLQKIVSLHGMRVGREIYRVSRRGSLEFLAALRRHKIACGLQTGSALHLTQTPDEESRLRREYSTRRAAGLDVSALSGTQLFQKAGRDGFAIRSRGQAVVDPYRASLGFARAAAARGALIFERSMRSVFITTTFIRTVQR